MSSMTLLAMAAPSSTGPANHTSPVFLFIWLMLWTAGISIICYRIAKQKGRCARLVAVLGVIPFINIFVLLYIALASNKNTEEILNSILAALLALKQERATPPAQQN